MTAGAPVCSLLLHSGTPSHRTNTRWAGPGLVTWAPTAARDPITMPVSGRGWGVRTQAPPGTEAAGPGTRGPVGAGAKAQVQPVSCPLPAEGPQCPAQVTRGDSTPQRAHGRGPEALAQGGGASSTPRPSCLHKTPGGDTCQALPTQISGSRPSTGGRGILSPHPRGWTRSCPLGPRGP